MFDWLAKRWQEVEVVIHMGAISSTTEPDADKIIHANFALSRDLFRWCADFQRRLIYASSARDLRRRRARLRRRQRPGRAGGAAAAERLWLVEGAVRHLRGAPGGARLCAAAMGGAEVLQRLWPERRAQGPMKSVAAQIWPDVAARRAR